MSDFPISVGRKNDIVIGLHYNYVENYITVSDLNETALNSLGYERDEIIGMDFMELLPPDISEYINEELEFSPTGRDLSFILRKIAHFSLINSNGNKTEYAVKTFPVASDSSNAMVYEILLRDKKRKHLQDSINAHCIGSIVNNIPNREAGDEILRTIIDYIKDNNIDIVAGIVTIDKLDEFYEEYGDNGMNELDNAIGKRFDDCCRAEDTLFFLSRGTYLVLLIDCTQSNAKLVFNRLRMFIEKSPAPMLNDEEISITVSISFTYLSKEIAGLNLIQEMENKHTTYGNQVSQINLRA